MRWREALGPQRMERVAVVAPRPCLRDVLVRTADAGQVDVDAVPGTDRTAPAGTTEERGTGQQTTGGELTPLLSPEPVDVPTLLAEGRADLVAGERALQRIAAGALERDGVAALTGWAPADELPRLQGLLAPLGGAVVRLRRPAGVDPPTRLPVSGGMRSSLRPLVDTYGTVPYADIDPTVVAGIAYVAMFGMMFGDVGHGSLLVLAGLLLRAGRPRRLARFSRAWLFVTGAGVAATFFGFLYGEFFGPTGVLSPLWLSPLEDPVQLLVAGIGVGAVLLALAYGLGMVNRWREGGWALALYAPSGVAGSALFLGLGAVAAGLFTAHRWLLVGGAGVWGVGLVLAYVGLLAAAGGGGTGVVQATVELFDTIIRVGANLLSFARLAAFGLAHAALSALVWEATTSVAGPSVAAVAVAVAVFVVGNALAFGLEALVAGVQALRLEYYELFSRLFVSEGRPFRAWHVELAPPAEHAPERTESPR